MSTVNFAALNQSLADLTTQVTMTETVEGGATKIIISLAAEIQSAVAVAVQKALADESVTDQGTVDAAVAAVYSGLLEEVRTVY